MTNKSRTITLPPADYQPTKAELEEEQDMPGAVMDTLRKAFLQRVEIECLEPADS